MEDAEQGHLSMTLNDIFCFAVVEVGTAIENTCLMFFFF